MMNVIRTFESVRRIYVTMTDGNLERITQRDPKDVSVFHGVVFRLVIEAQVAALSTNILPAPAK